MTTEIADLPGREELDARVWSMLCIVYQSFDSGGESMRSQRSQALEAAIALVRERCSDDAMRSAANERDALGRWDYISAARRLIGGPDAA